jgi:hypothetical protein
MTNIIKILEEAAMSGPHVVVVTEPDSGFKIAIGSYPDGYAARVLYPRPVGASHAAVAAEPASRPRPDHVL